MNLNEIILPFTPTEQVQDGCVTASARGIIGHLGLNFETNFLPNLQDYSLDYQNPENNHMLGVAVVAVKLGYSVIVHSSQPIQSKRFLNNVPVRAKKVHLKAIKDILLLEQENKIVLETDVLNLHNFQDLLKKRLLNGFYCLAILNWNKWNIEAQRKFGNPRHIIAIVGMKDDDVITIDPSIPINRQPFIQPVKKLFAALTEEQQLIFLGKPENER